jgi:hypothetical protein
MEPWNVYVLNTEHEKVIGSSATENLLDQQAEKLNSHDCYKTLNKLSLLKQEFLLFEYFE